MDFEQFKKKVMRTATSVREGAACSNESRHVLDAIYAGKLIDLHKRTIFYGCEKSIGKLASMSKLGEVYRDAHKTFFNAQTPIKRMSPGVEEVLKHIIFGLVTESAECLEALMIAESEKDFDHVNFQEELGDLLWYITYYCHEYDVTLEDLMKKNVAKLDKRYKEKFTTDEAVNRDLETERKELEK
jgi:NTP pyrophosphatase (non-canonical NTP hydrolase)